MESSTVTAPPTHMQRIKDGIWDIHEGVSAKADDKTEPEESVMKGNLPRFKYVNNVAQRYLLQKGFEEILREHRNDPLVSRVVTDEQFHADKAAADLRFFGVEPETVKPVPATEKMIQFFRDTAKKDPRLLLAIHYTIEGSNNGAMYIAQAVKKAYNLEGTDGTYHLQPYGDAIRAKWKAWGESFNALPIDDALMSEMVRVGRQTFHFMNGVARQAHGLPERGA